MTKWIDGPTGVVGDTNVTEVNGSVVVGNGTFKGNLQIFGGAVEDVFAGMGPNLITGPGFNYGYGGSTFGRSAGFFNVRRDGSATPPNPSLRFMTSNVQRMIITNAGDIGIGTNSPDRKVTVFGTGGTYLNVRADNGTEEILIGADAGGGIVSTMTNHDLQLRAGSNTTHLIIKASGDVLPTFDGFQFLGGPGKRWNSVWAVSGTIQTSDRRLKQRIEALGYGLRHVLQLRPVSFEWKDDRNGRRYLGLIAQEVEPLIPEVIERGRDPDGPLGMNYASLVPVVIKAIQDQQVTIEQLTEENAMLKARVAAIEDALARTRPRPIRRR